MKDVLKLQQMEAKTNARFGSEKSGLSYVCFNESALSLWRCD